MLNASDTARNFWAATQDHINRYGAEAASDFAVLSGVRSILMEAMDALTEKADNVQSSQAITHSFEILWDLVVQEHNLVLVRQRKASEKS